jgi:hypothetical protein
MGSMLSRLFLLLALGACGRIGFGNEGTGVDALVGGDAGMSTQDASPVLGSVTCPTERTSLGDPDGVEIIAEGASTPMVAWRTSAGVTRIATLTAGSGLANVQTPFGMTVDRLAGAYPIGDGHALAVQANAMEMLYAVSSDFSTVGLRGQGGAGVGRATVTGFGAYVFWGHVSVANPRALLFERLAADGTPTAQSNRTTGADVRDLVVAAATDSHAHLMWAEADDTCTASELFGGIPDLVDVHEIQGCRSPRSASGVGDAITTAYSTTSGALRLYALSDDYEHDIELSPSAHDPVLADDGNVVWGVWFDDRVGGALVLAKIELTPTSATVTPHQLEGVMPTGPAAVTLVDNASPARLLVLEAGMLAVVQPCI